jgi:succinate dehydrogenase / fumarate reductase, membrane anchor subunit
MQQAAASPASGSGRRTGVWPWLLQRVTGGLILIWISVHICFWHFRHAHSDGITANGVASGIRTPLWVFWGVALGGLCLFHGLSGIRNILYDYGLGERHGRWITAALWAIGLTAFVWVTYNLSLFAAFQS